MLEAFIIQLIGFVGWLFLVVSYWRKKVNDVLVLQAVSCILFAIHYYLLGAMSGLYIVLFETIRDFTYYKFNEDLKLFTFSIPIYILIAVVSFDGIMSVLPSLASLIDGFSLTGNKSLILFGSLISYAVWFIYDLFCHSYAGMLTNLILIGSNLLVLITSFKDRKKKVN